MAKPWEKYQTAAEAGPWTKYQGTVEPEAPKERPGFFGSLMESAQILGPSFSPLAGLVRVRTGKPLKNLLVAL